MNIPDDAWEVLKGYAQVEEPVQITTISGRRNCGPHGEREVTVVIHAYPPRDGRPQYMAGVRGEGLPHASGSNMEDSIAAALRGIHWYELDR